MGRDTSESYYVTLRDGRELLIREATAADAATIANAHPLPRDGTASAVLYRNYYKLKALLYLRTAGAGVLTGWVDGSLAAFVFYCSDLARIRKQVLSLGGALWLLREMACGRFGYRPSFWLEAARWALQHVRQPQRYGSADDRGAASPERAADYRTWVGTVHTVDAFRRLGIATAVLGQVHRRLAEAGCEEVALWAAGDNVPALELYERLAYARVSLLERIGERCWLMVRQLASPVGVPAAVVTDAAERVAVHVVRGLGRKGVAVTALELTGRYREVPGYASRYCTSHRSAVSWEEDESRWLQDILAAASPGDVLLPTCLNTILRVLAHRQELTARYHMLLPELPALLTANDKWELHQVCTRLGLRTPATWCLSRQSLEQRAPHLPYPLVVKFRHDQDLYDAADRRYRVVHEPAELLQCWQQFHEVQPSPVIQQYIAGDGYGFEGLFDSRGTLVASFCHRRLVEYPNSGGPSAVCESVHMPELVERGRQLLEHLDWRGVAMVEFKRCAATGEFHVLEVNPRFWGSLPLAEAAGINFPYLLYLAARGEPLPRVEYRTGVRMRLTPTYLLSVYSSFREAPWRAGWLSRLRYLIDPRVHEGLFTLDDLGPAWAYMRSRVRRELR